MGLVANTKIRGLNGGTTPAIDTTGATFLVASVAYDQSVTPTVSDSKSNTWTALTARSAASQGKSQLFYAVNPTVGTGHTFTVSAVGASASVMFVAAFDDVLTVSPFDVENGTSTGSGNIQPGSVTPSQSGELLITGLELVGTTSIDSGFTILGQEPGEGGVNYGGAAAYAYQGAAAAINPTWTVTGSCCATIAAFKVDTTASTYVITGPTAGPVGAESATFTVTLDGLPSGTEVITPSATGCTFTPSSLSFSGATSALTFTINAAAAGTKTISFTSSTLDDPANASYVAKLATTKVLTWDDGIEGNDNEVAIKNLDGTYFSDFSGTGVTDQGNGVFSVSKTVPADMSGIAIRHDTDLDTYYSRDLFPEIQDVVDAVWAYANRTLTS